MHIYTSFDLKNETSTFALPEIINIYGDTDRYFF